ncbi:phosphoribosyltransferase [Rhizobiales bacterium]|uniref:phosphoribosyltransferase n=1 Tax=Hongsoonwoonella zoysiae TaxID=2821844 RepID=UPI0015619FE9|nr:phosphoribosyltransferase [Hongsoonwoonella zoysiae]NRG18736.1 phosphoribosyltransferase [Hongsoonwoonella zoysiae]
MMFDDRTDAGRKLAGKLSDYKGRDAVVLALPRGGLPVAAQIAEQLDAPLDLLIVRKIGVPWQPELAMGALIDGDEPVTVRNDNVIRLAWVSAGDFDKAAEQALKEIERRRQQYIDDRPRAGIEGRIAIVVDDGIATGATVRAAIRGLSRKNPAKIILAVPVAPPETIAELAREVDEVICLYSPETFQAISPYYRHFDQLDDKEVIGILTAHPIAPAKQGVTKSNSA